MTAVFSARTPSQITPETTSFTASVGTFRASVDTGGYVTLGGQLGDDALEALRAVLDQALLEGGDIVIDAAQLTFIAKAAITELLCFQLFAAVEDRELRIVRMSPPVANLIDRLDLRPHLTARGV